MKTAILTIVFALAAATAQAGPHDMQVETRVLNKTVIRKLCPNPNARCKVRDNPEFYKDTDPEFYNRITKRMLPRSYRGDWCLTMSVQNGHDAITREFIPHTNVYERKVDCPAENRISIGSHSLDGLDYEISDGALIVEGQPKVKHKKTNQIKKEK